MYQTAFYRASCLSQQLDVREKVTLLREIQEQLEKQIKEQKEREIKYFCLSPDRIRVREYGKEGEKSCSRVMMVKPQSLEQFVLGMGQRGDRVVIHFEKNSSTALVEIYQSEEPKGVTLFGKEFRGAVYVVPVTKVGEFFFLCNSEKNLDERDTTLVFSRLILEEWSHKDWFSFQMNEEEKR